MNEYELEHPMRITIVRAAAQALKVGDAELMGIAVDAIDHCDMHAYDALDDAPKSLTKLINALVGSDDDHDDFVHDLSHALNDLEPCDEHPHINCATCCDLDHE